jgi:uncharacterized protein (TIGR00369 family)
MHAPDTLAATLHRWETVETAARARLAPPGVIGPAQAAGRTGLQVLQAISAGELPSPIIGTTMDFWPVEVEFGRIVFQGRPNAAYLNPMGSVHGGWFATLLDSAVGCAVHSTLPLGKGYTTAELKVSFVRAISAKTGVLRCEGKVINVGGRLGFAEGRIVGPDGKLYAHASTTCLIFDHPTAPAPKQP